MTVKVKENEMIKQKNTLRSMGRPKVGKLVSSALRDSSLMGGVFLMRCPFRLGDSEPRRALLGMDSLALFRFAGLTKVLPWFAVFIYAVAGYDAFDDDTAFDFFHEILGFEDSFLL